MRREIKRSAEFTSWYEELTAKQQRIIDVRVARFEVQGLLVGSKLLSKEFFLFEFKWTSGLRVYFTILSGEGGKLMLLLVGGNKNSQESDINLVKKLIFKILRG